jgi:hypothetical protein
MQKSKFHYLCLLHTGYAQKILEIQSIFWKLEPELSGLLFVSDRNDIAKSDDQNFKELKKVCVLCLVLSFC